ncbi:hypothetical protein J2S44_007387 [Catenuloplanes niger]|uniref:Uncharacterized protein n=1 Tax=Catenuloplanes niger TaxID=587534 RepID=A0AAE3ZY96_9ACTN|nr:hypothetical protein [Catenuloplanes niger]
MMRMSPDTMWQALQSPVAMVERPGSSFRGHGVFRGSQRWCGLG